MKNIIAKKTIAIAVATSWMAFATQTTLADTVTTTTTIKVSRQDPGFTPPSSCPFSGGGCDITVTTTTTTSNIVASPGGGYYLNVPSLPMTVTVLRGTGPVTAPAVDRAIVFPPGSAFQITSCTAFPLLVGTIVDVSGTATNGVGGFTQPFIP